MRRNEIGFSPSDERKMVLSMFENVLLDKPSKVQIDTFTSRLVSISDFRMQAETWGRLMASTVEPSGLQRAMTHESYIDYLLRHVDPAPSIRRGHGKRGAARTVWTAGTYTSGTRKQWKEGWRSHLAEYPISMEAIEISDTLAGFFDTLPILVRKDET